MTARRFAELAAPKLYDALKRIASYQSPDKLRRIAEREYGLQPEEAVEMAYENVIEEAKAAIRGIRRPVVKELAALILLFAALLFALPMKAQSSAADQLYCPIVVHAAGSPSWGTEITISNSGDDPVAISLIYFPSNASDSDPSAPLPLRFPDRIRVKPHGTATLSDYDLGRIIGPNGTGMLILNACKDGESCMPVLIPFIFANMTRFTLFALPRQFRAISAEVHVYTYVPNPIRSVPPLATRGDAYLAVPWWKAVQPTDGPVSLPWIKSDAQHATTIGAANASAYASIELLFTLIDGTGVQRGEWKETLCALCSVRRSAESSFPMIATNRLNRRPPLTGMSVRVEMIGSTPNELAAKEKDVEPLESCVGGCPMFLTYATVTDSSAVVTPCPSGQVCIPDIHFITPEFEQPDRSRTGEQAPPCLGPNCFGPPQRPGTFHTGALSTQHIVAEVRTCRVVEGKWSGDYLLERLIDGRWIPMRNVDAPEAGRALEQCGAATSGGAQ